LIATPGYIKNNIEGRAPKISLKHIKMVIIDEVDEIFNNEDIQRNLDKIINIEFK
jgi:superfamily II DNA/RNA helicase